MGIIFIYTIETIFGLKKNVKIKLDTFSKKEKIWMIYNIICKPKLYVALCMVHFLLL